MGSYYNFRASARARGRYSLFSERGWRGMWMKRNNRACRPFSRIYDLNAAMEKLLNSPTPRKDFTMKKTVLVLLLILTFTVVHAQTIVIESPGILTDLSTAIIGVPAAAVTGIVSGIVEAGHNLVCGGTTIVTNP